MNKEITSISQLAKAFIEAQKEMGNAAKDSSNPFFKSKYADLNSVRDACLPALNKHGIAVLQPIVQVEGKNYVKTLLLHESGESMECLTEIIFAKQNDAQAQGSGITYARRYGLQSMVNVGAEDDDGHKASEAPKQQKQPIKDLPKIEEFISAEQGIELAKLAKQANIDICKAYKIEKIIDLPASKFEKTKNGLLNKIANKPKIIEGLPKVSNELTEEEKLAIKAEELRLAKEGE